MGAAVTCTHPGPLASGASLPNITLTTASARRRAERHNTANVSSPTFDPSTANNGSTATTPVLYITLNKTYTLNGPQPAPGAEITYTVAFSNLGGTTVQNFYLVDVIPFSVAGSSIVRSTEFKTGSMTFSPGSTALTLPSAACATSPTPSTSPRPRRRGTRPPPHARRRLRPPVSYVGWQFNGTMAPNTSGSVTFTVRIR